MWIVCLYMYSLWKEFWKWYVLTDICDKYMQWYQYINAWEIWWYLINTHVVWWLWNRNWLAHCPSTCLLLCWAAIHGHNACTSPSGVCYSPSGVCLAYGLLFHLRVSAFQVRGMCLSLYCVYHNSDCYYMLLSGIRNSDMYLNSDINWALICT